MKQHAHVSVQDPRVLLREIGARATPGRIALIELLSSEEHPLSIYEIMRRLSARKRVSIDHATAFRSLEALTSAGLLQKSDLGHGHAHYEWVQGRPHHHHVVCTMCGYVAEVEGCDISHIEKDILQKTPEFTGLESHTLEFFGLCRACARTAEYKKRS